jgi:flagellin
MVDAINLSAQTSTNLLALRRTTEAIAVTQERLSTGLRVNSAIDDPIAFFDSRGLTNRASDLQVLKDDIDQAVSITEVAVTGLESIEDLVEQMKGLALDAQSDS